MLNLKLLVNKSLLCYCIDIKITKVWSDIEGKVW